MASGTTLNTAAPARAGKYFVTCWFHDAGKKSLTTEKTTNAAWRTKPTFYAVSTQDRTINPDLERFMAKRMGAKTIEIEASHLALISHPDAITNLILAALAA